jgi:ABC-2 type transport system ATP-binding protein
MDTIYSEVVIKTTDLSKTYQTTTGFFKKKKKETLAVENVNLEIHKGELFGLVGPNGAGKTTIVKMLTTLLLPTSGGINILGYDVVKQPKQIRSQIGFIFGGSRGVYTRLSAIDNLRYFSELYGVDPAISKKRIDELLDLVGLKGREQERVETYSTGMLQRLQIARMLLHSPRLLFLDEPTIGLDPVAAREFRNLIKDLTALGNTVLLTSHYMLEIDQLCGRVAVINHGKIILMDTPESIKHKIKQENVCDIYIADAHYPTTLEVVEVLKKQFSTSQEKKNEHQILSVYNADPQDVLKLIAPLLELRHIHNIEIRQPTLEDAYIKLIKEE